MSMLENVFKDFSYFTDLRPRKNNQINYECISKKTMGALYVKNYAHVNYLGKFIEICTANYYHRKDVAN